MADLPNHDEVWPPGHATAVRWGCTCPQIDNHYGKGIPAAGGKARFIINADCPEHGQAALRRPRVSFARKEGYDWTFFYQFTATLAGKVTLDDTLCAYTTSRGNVTRLMDMWDKATDPCPVREMAVTRKLLSIHNEKLGEHEYFPSE